MRLGAPGLRRIEAAVKALDPDGRFVSLDVKAQAVKYSEEIVQHEERHTYVGEEEPCRAYVVCWLCTEGGYLPANLELEKSYSIGRPKVGAQLDVLVNHVDGTPYALIEVKAPAEYDREADKYIEGQLFNIAPLEQGCRVLSFASVEAESDVAIVSTTIAYDGTLTFAEWREARASSPEIPANYGEPVHQHFEKGGARDLRGAVSHAYLDKLRRRLHDVLWRGSKPDNLVYEYVVKLFLAKIYDEKSTSEGSRYRFQVLFTGSHRESVEETFERISSLYLEAYDRYLNIDGSAMPEPLNESEFSAEQIAFVVELLEDIALTSTDVRAGDVLGGFFEAITRDGFKQSKGLFFTHLNLAVFILLALDLPALTIAKIQTRAVASERLPYVIDPACGSGTFLLAAMKLVTDEVDARRREIATNDDVREFLNEKFPESHPNLWAKDCLFGIDDSALLSMATKVNMVLHRDGNTHIYKADGLAPLSRYTDQFLKGGSHPNPSIYSKPIASAFDVVVSNPPFSITLDPQTTAQLDATFELAGNRNSENLYLERWYQLLKPGGRLGVVMPESFFSTRENLDARLFLFDHFDVKAVVGISRQAFEPWTPTKTCLLFAKKKTPEDERAWIEQRRRAEGEARELKALGTRALRTLVRALSSLAPAGVATLGADNAAKALQTLGHEAPAAIWTTFDEFGSTAEKFEELAALPLPSGAKPQERAARTLLGREVRRLRKLHRDLDEAIAEFRQALGDLDFDLDVPDGGSAFDAWQEALESAREMFGRFSPAVWSFRRVVEGVEDQIKMLNVANIGYKRTRRNEYRRRNDLFTAVAVEAPDEARVWNLNLATSGWRIVVDSVDPHDALSELRQADIWHG